jgi:endonuclease/exonuclease/phosphatase family metal-dependent hydrolase
MPVDAAISKHNSNSPPPRFARNRAYLAIRLALLVVAVTLIDASIQRPADPVEPLIFERTDRFVDGDSLQTLRIATFNIHAGVGRDGVRDLGRTADALSKLDIAALQEVRNPLLSFDGPQISNLADKLRMAWVFVPAERRWWHNDYGTGLLTRIAPVDCLRIPLPTANRRRFRTAVLTNFKYQARLVHLLAVHIDLDEERDVHNAQLRTVADLFLSLQEPAILLGDLNDVSTHPEIARLLNTPGVHNALARIPAPTVKTNPIDWIFTRGFDTVRAEWLVNPASDHPVARADLKLSNGREAQAAPVNHGSLGQR